MSTNPRRDQDRPHAPAALVEDLAVHTHTHSNLARGIVWADILADIAADEQARQLRDAA